MDDAEITASRAGGKPEIKVSEIMKVLLSPLKETTHTITGYSKICKQCLSFVGFVANDRKAFFKPQLLYLLFDSVLFITSVYAYITIFVPVFSILR